MVSSGVRDGVTFLECVVANVGIHFGDAAAVISQLDEGVHYRQNISRNTDHLSLPTAFSEAARGGGAVFTGNAAPRWTILVARRLAEGCRGLTRPWGTLLISPSTVL